MEDSSIEQSAVIEAPPAPLGQPPLAAALAHDSLKRRAVRSSLWTLSAFAIGQVIRVITNPILAKLLVVEYFGIVSLVSVFVGALQAMCDVGLEQAVIQSKRGDDPRFLNTIWTLHIVRGAALLLGTCILAYPLYLLYSDKPEGRYLLLMLPAAGLGPLINGFNSTSTFTMFRHLRLGRMTMLTLAFQIVTAIVTIALAWWNPSPWSIIFGGLAGNFFFMACSHFLLPGYRNWFCWDAEVRREILHFGRWIIVSTMITYTAMQIDRPIVGKLLDIRWLGLYAIAANLVMMPRDVVGRLASVSLYPALARAAESRPEELQRVLLRARSLIMLVTMGLTIGVILGGPVFIMTFYPREYHDAGWLTQLAALGAWFVMIQSTADRGLLVIGRTKPLAVSNAVNLLVTLLAGFALWWLDRRVGWSPEGIAGFMIGLALGKIAGHAMILAEMARRGLSVLSQDVKYTLGMLLIAAVGVVLPRMLPAFDQGFVPKLLCMAIVAFVVGGAACAWAALRVWRGIR